MPKDRVWSKARQHWETACEEARAAGNILLPEAFGKHARASRQEAKLALEACCRAIRSCCPCIFAKRPSLKRKIDIA